MKIKYIPGPPGPPGPVGDELGGAGDARMGCGGVVSVHEGDAPGVWHVYARLASQLVLCSVVGAAGVDVAEHALEEAEVGGVVLEGSSLLGGNVVVEPMRG